MTIGRELAVPGDTSCRPVSACAPGRWGDIPGDASTVYVRPELVVEIAFNEVQQSSQYPAGFALRFARVKGYRPDKKAEEADTIETVRRIFRGAPAKA